VSAALVNAVGWALIHFVWQGALVALLLAAVLALAPRRAARVRYAAACTALLVLAFLPMATAVRHHPASVGSPAAPLERDVAVTLGHGSRMGAVARGEPERVIGPALEAIERHADHLVLVWALGVIITSARVLTGLRHLVHLTRSAEAAPAVWARTFERLRRTIGVRAPVRLLASHLVDVPCAVGWLEPLVLVPVSVLSGLSTHELELILAHELAHIRRHDYLVNLMQTGVETLLFYHPAVWWVSHVIRTERENCCDDVAVQVAPTPVAYARALTALETLRVSPALALSATGSPLGARVRRLVTPEVKQVSRFSAGVTVVTLASALALAAIAVPSRAADRAAPSPAPAATAAASPAPAAQPAPAAKPQPASVPAPGVHIHEHARREPAAADRAVVGRDPLTVDQLIELRIAGVDRARAEALAALGIEPSVDTLVTLAHAGVTPERVKALRALFGERLTTEHVIEMSHLGVTSEYVQELTALGLGVADAQHAIDARAVGVTASWAKALKAAGLALPDLGVAIDLRALGVDGPYLDDLAAAGIRGLSAPQVEELRGVGVTGRFAKELADVGLGGLGPAELVELRALGVDPAFVRKMKAAGLEQLSAPDLVRLKAAGVTPEYLEQLRRH